jgi:hypothetical protein
MRLSKPGGRSGLVVGGGSSLIMASSSPRPRKVSCGGARGYRMQQPVHAVTDKGAASWGPAPKLAQLAAQAPPQCNQCMQKTAQKTSETGLSRTVYLRTNSMSRSEPRVESCCARCPTASTTMDTCSWYSCRRQGGPILLHVYDRTLQLKGSCYSCGRRGGHCFPIFHLS